jgi:hypothetical protein
MHTSHDSMGTGSCGCSGCPIPDCPVEEGPEGSPLFGWRLGLASMGLFLGPIILAIVGAVCSGQTILGESHEAQFLGGIAGLGLGLAGSVGTARLLRRAKNKNA